MKTSHHVQRIIDAVQAAGQDGITLNVLSLRLCMSRNGPCAAVNKLVQEGKIFKTNDPLNNRVLFKFFSTKALRDQWFQNRVSENKRKTQSELSYENLPRFTKPAGGKIVESRVMFRLPTENPPILRKGADDFRKCPSRM